MLKRLTEAGPSPSRTAVVLAAGAVDCVAAELLSRDVLLPNGTHQGQFSFRLERYSNQDQERREDQGEGEGAREDGWWRVLWEHRLLHNTLSGWKADERKGVIQFLHTRAGNYIIVEHTMQKLFELPLAALLWIDRKCLQFRIRYTPTLHVSLRAPVRSYISKRSANSPLVPARHVMQRR